jgi:branched-chain amino acid transport system substrate-binding protein
MKKLILTVVSVIVIAGFILAGCAPQAAAPGTPTGPAVAGPTEIIIAGTHPTTGPFAGFGVGGEWGEKAATADVNAEGGVYVKELGKKLPIKLILANSESSPEKAGALLEDLIINGKANFLASANQPLPTEIPMAIVADKYKIPFTTGGNPYEPWLGVRNSATPPFEYTWTYNMAIATPGPAGSYWEDPAGWSVTGAWKLFMDKYGPETNKKVAVFASDEPDGRGWYESLPMVLGAWKYTAVGIEKNLGLFPPDTNDFSSIIREWIANDCQILWGNCIGPTFGTMLRQASSMGFKPKIIMCGRAPLFYEDVNSWGGDLPNGVGVEIWWDPNKSGTGYNGTTCKSLSDRWMADTGQPVNRGIAMGYWSIQTMAKAIELAGSIDKEKVQAAFKELDYKDGILIPNVKFDKDHCCMIPVCFGQWQKVDKPYKWECQVVFNANQYYKVTAPALFPIPYK